MSYYAENRENMEALRTLCVALREVFAHCEVGAPEAISVLSERNQEAPESPLPVAELMRIRALSDAAESALRFHLEMLAELADEPEVLE